MDTTARLTKILKKVGTNKAEIPFIRSDLIGAYREPGRFYHNLSHVTSCLEELDNFIEKCPDLIHPDSIDIIELAIFYHDYVYDPFSKTNEKESAVLAVKDLLMLDNNNDCIADDVFKAIILTEHRAAPEINLSTSFMTLIMDIDLAILGKNTKTFKKYCAGIRNEYSSVEESVYNENRKIFLEGMLKRPLIYRWKYFQNKYEDRARFNIKNAIEELTPKRKSK